MSYILDALKKSEQERQRGNVPDIKAVHNSPAKTATESRRSWWIYLFVLVLLVNGAIFAVVYLGDAGNETATQAFQESNLAALSSEQESAKATAPVVEAVQPETLTTTTPVEQTATPVQQTPPSSDSKEPVQQPKKQPRVIFSKEPLDMSTDIPDVQAALADSASAKQDDVAATDKDDANLNEAVLIAELPASVRQKIPNIEFAGHVYSTSVERRSVMINGKKMREGDVVGSGLILQAITPEGAEFEYEGYRFKLGALQDWSFR